jgi:hypothetical protein
MVSPRFARWWAGFPKLTRKPKGLLAAARAVVLDFDPCSVPPLYEGTRNVWRGVAAKRWSGARAI